MPRLSDVTFTVVKRKDKDDLIFAECSDGRFFVNVNNDALKSQIIDAADNGVAVDIDVRNYKEPQPGSFVLSAFV